MPKPVKNIRPVRPPAAATPPKPPSKPSVSSQSKRSAFLIMLGLPLFLISSVVLYRRVIEGRQKRVQLGEYTPDGGLRLFSKEETEEKDKNSWMTRIFGSEK